MRGKKVIALLISCLGVGLLGTSFYYKHKLSEAKLGVDSLLTPLSGNPFGTLIGMDAKNTLKKYQIKIHLLMATGALVTAFGFSYFVYLRHKKASK